MNALAEKKLMMQSRGHYANIEREKKPADRERYIEKDGLGEEKEERKKRRLNANADKVFKRWNC